MSRRRRRQPKTPGARAFQIVEGVTLLWLVAGAVSFWPFPIVPTWKPYFFVSTVAVVAVWWWAIAVIRKSRAAGKRLDELKAMTPVEFEEWVAARFKDLGYKVKTTALSGDHGVDLVAHRENEKVVVQCKRYRDYTIGEPVMRDLYGTMQHESATRAYLVTTSFLTPAALSWSRGKPIEIWDATYLSKMATAATESQASVLAGLGPDVAASHCPNCELALVERHNRRSGEAFLGCSGYPRCRYTRPLSPAQA